jgi:DNA-binding HxlR family transcriptional regulator
MEDLQFRTNAPPGGVDATSGPCPLRTALGAIGGRWKPLVLNHLLQRPHGFGELSRALDGVSNKTLTTQLRELVRDGLIARVVCDDARRSVSYSLTEDGASLKPVLRSLIDWGNWWVATGRASAKNCGVEE